MNKNNVYLYAYILHLLRPLVNSDLVLVWGSVDRSIARNIQRRLILMYIYTRV